MAMKPDPDVSEPPEISHLSMVPQTWVGLPLVASSPAPTKPSSSSTPPTTALERDGLPRVLTALRRLQQLPLRDPPASRLRLLQHRPWISIDHSSVSLDPALPHIMAPSWVLLDREVSFVRGGAPVIGNPWRGMSYKEIRAAVTKAMKPHLDIADPPGVSRLSMLRQQNLQGLPCGSISSTDGALVLLYAGMPWSSHEGYLVYDASSNSITTVPELDANHCLYEAAILSCGEDDGAYVLAELAAGFDDAALYLWWSASNHGRWIRSAARLPPQLFTPMYSFTVDTAFSYAGSSVCWADLLAGVLVCDLLKSPERPEFTFVPLPASSSIDVLDEPREGRPVGVGRPRPAEFRTMGCVGGAIMFVSLAGFYEDQNPRDMALETWTLSRDLREWQRGEPLPVADLWESESFRERGLPQLIPTFPVLAMDDAEVVCVTLNDIDYEKRVNSYGEVRRGRMLHKAQYMLCLNTVRNKIISSRELIPEDFKPHFPELIASGFSAYLQDS